MRTLIQKAIKTPDGTILNSSNLANYQLISHLDSVSQKTYSIMGGLKEDITKDKEDDSINLNLYTDSSFLEARSKLCWGTYGINGDEQFKWIILKDMDTCHIEKILSTQYSINTHLKNFFKNELTYRKVNNFFN